MSIYFPGSRDYAMNEIFGRKKPGPGHDIASAIAAHNEQHKGGVFKRETKHVIDNFKGVSADGNKLHFDDKATHRFQAVGTWKYDHKKNEWHGHTGAWHDDEGRLLTTKQVPHTIDSTQKRRISDGKVRIKHDQMVNHLKTHNTPKARKDDKEWQHDQAGPGDALGGLM